MSTLRRFTIALGAALLVLALAAGPAMATESGEEGGGTAETEQTGTAEEDGKLQLPSRPRDQVGLGLLALLILGGLLALDNVRRQLRGDRGQADGKWRYR